MLSMGHDLTGAGNPVWLKECIDSKIASSAMMIDAWWQDRPWKSLDVVTATMVRLKPGKRCLVLYDCCTSCGQRVRILGKVRFRGLDRKSLPLTNHLLECGFGHSGNLTKTTAMVPRVWGQIARWNMILFEYVEGVSAEPRRDVQVGDHTMVADAICDLHEVAVRGGAEFTAASELEILRRLYIQFASEHPQWSEQAWRILCQLQSLARGIKPSRICLIHRDFYFDQVLFLPEMRVAVLDLDLACSGPPELDAGNYIAHLREIAIRSPSLDLLCKAAERSFTARFLARSRAVTGNVLSFWTLVALARLAVLSVHFPGRLHTTEPLLRSVESDLGKPNVDSLRIDLQDDSARF
jgi:hypothetical protein